VTSAVKVEETTRKGEPHIKFASAHDLRRSFGERWALRVMPQVLMELMRHESIDTTMQFYVGRNAERTADALWAAVEEKPLRATEPSGGTAGESRNEKTPGNPEVFKYTRQESNL
jgi:integrase